jgi:hypothetical protein
MTSFIFFSYLLFSISKRKSSEKSPLLPITSQELRGRDRLPPGAAQGPFKPADYFTVALPRIDPGQRVNLPCGKPSGRDFRES